MTASSSEGPVKKAANPLRTATVSKELQGGSRSRGTATKLEPSEYI